MNKTTSQYSILLNINFKLVLENFALEALHTPV